MPDAVHPGNPPQLVRSFQLFIDAFSFSHLGDHSFHTIPTDLICFRQMIIQLASPTYFDVIIALAGGVAGVIGQTRKDKVNNIIPGVAIATALMPPLCTCGYSIANGRWWMLGGAAYLFLLNAYFIFLASYVILSVLRIPKVRELSEAEWKRLRRKMIRNTIIILVPSIIFGIMLY